MTTRPTPMRVPLTADELRLGLLEYIAFLRASQPLYTDPYLTRERTLDSVEYWVKAMGRRPS